MTRNIKLIFEELNILKNEDRELTIAFLIWEGNLRVRDFEINLIFNNKNI